MTQSIRALAAALFLAASLSVPLAAQGSGPGTGGLVRLAEERRMMGNWRRVLMIGAHPDDEDTELLTILARGQGIETAYLSLTRGDGGQNLIGNELGASMGVLRTEELLAARRIDGGRQFFGREFDFGFSKSAAEAFEFWPKDSVLKDAVRIIRRFKPQVVVGVWSGTPADGHGHHQAAGIIALEAFRAAGDSTRFPEMVREEGLAPWRPLKYYRTLRGNAAMPGAELSFDGGAIDPVRGLSYHQIAVQSRGQHRSQNQGNLETLGPSRARVGLVERVASITGRDDSLFAGVPPESAPTTASHRDAVVLIENGIVLDATTDDDEVVPGQELTVTLSAMNGGRDTVKVEARPGTSGFPWRGSSCGGLVAVAPGTLYSCKYVATARTSDLFTTPYFLRLPRIGAMYQWSGDRRVWGESFEAPPLQASFFVVGQKGELEANAVREVQARFLDPVLGEIRRPIALVPRVAVELAPDQLLWPRNTTKHPFRVSLENLAKEGSDVTVSLTLPQGWRTTAAQSLKFSREGERATVDFVVTAPLNQPAGEFDVSALVVSGSDTLRNGLYRIRYPHIGPRNILTTAKARVVVADVKFPTLAMIGYVRGGGDLIPEAMQNSGLPVKLLTGDVLERMPLDGFKTIVIGPRAYESDESLRRAHPRLMRWLNAGGTLLILYQQQPYMRGGFAPKPFLINNPMDRVTDEKSAVTLIAPMHPALRTPNVIGPKDFEGWIQERGLDFARSWDPAWVPVLETHDQGDTLRAGGLIIAKVGKGTAIYTGLSFNRQLPAAVPGAWRLFANLLALGRPTVAR